MLADYHVLLSCSSHSLQAPHCSTSECCSEFIDVTLSPSGVGALLAKQNLLVRQLVGAWRGLLQKLFCYKQASCKEMGCPVPWSLATRLVLASQVIANQGSALAKLMCKCRCQNAGHLQVQIPVGRLLTSGFGSPLNEGC